MAGINEENLPFVRFSDVLNRERHHYNRNTGFCYERGFVLLKLEEKAPTFYARLMEFGWTPLTKAPTDALDIPLNDTFINEALEFTEVSNAEYEAKLREIDLGWLRDTLIEPAHWGQVYWVTVEGITSSDWSADIKRWLHLVTRRIRLSGNRVDVTFPRALVVVCAIQGIELNVGVQNISEWKMFYRGNKKAFFLPKLITALCRRECHSSTLMRYYPWIPLSTLF
uniref:Putative plant transposon protein domain-containing protein n=1 Tax=Solanum tuberosum TaxID=4113 RepID=M1DZD2_SOLTU